MTNSEVKKNLSKCEKEKDVLKNSNIASHKWVMLEGKVPSKSVKKFLKKKLLCCWNAIGVKISEVCLCLQDLVTQLVMQLIIKMVTQLGYHNILEYSC